MKLYTNVKPLFVAEGTSKEHGRVIYLFKTYDEAQKMAKELIHLHYGKVSAYRAAELIS